MMKTMKTPLPGFCRALLVAACCSVLAGCAGQGGFFGDEKPAFRDPALKVGAARQMLVDGQTTRPEVVAALGPATVIHFDSGREIWVYRGHDAIGARGMSASELVILFSANGVVQKSRIRPPYPLAER